MIIPRTILHRRKSVASLTCDQADNAPTTHVTILALSVAKRDEDFRALQVASESGRELLSDKKGAFDHLRPRAFLYGAFRVASIQSCNMLTYYLSDQLQQEKRREELVYQGILTADEADQQNEAWEKTEWESRVARLPTRILHGFLKFHAITLVMRFYEGIASKIYSYSTVDNLTMDYFKAGIRVTNESNGDSSAIRTKMYDTCFWSNLIAYMADYSVHQIILGVTYYLYYRKRRQRVKTEQSDGEDSEDVEGPLVLSFLSKSARLALSRALGLTAGAYCGAVGTVVWPGWGTMMGFSFGDGMVATFFDIPAEH